MRWTAFILALSAGIVPAAAQNAPDMSFRRIDAPNLCKRCDVVQASGLIVSDTPDRFREFLDRERVGGKPLVVVLDSPGGKVRAGWLLGRKLRSLSASVIAASLVERRDGAIEVRPGLCVSMCNSILAAGVERRISPGTIFGVHQFSPTADYFRNLDNTVTVRDMRDQLKMLSEWLAYAREMKVDQRLVEAQLNVPYEKVDFISHDTLAAWKVVTAPGATIPKLLRNPRAGSDALASGEAAASPTPASFAAAAAAVGDRQWTAVRVQSDWRETSMESYADFLRVNVGCANNGRIFLQVTLRGAPEEKQRALAQQIIASGGFELVERPVDIAQVTMGFGSAFWVRASLRPDQIARLASSGGRFSFTPTLAKNEAAKRDALQVQTSGFNETVGRMISDCSGKKAAVEATAPRG
ncbi:MAG: hypothetical protein ABWZ80_10590 [Beijerinckiaceae bacterium]